MSDPEKTPPSRRTEKEIRDLERQIAEMNAHTEELERQAAIAEAERKEFVRRAEIAEAQLRQIELEERWASKVFRPFGKLAAEVFGGLLYK